LRIWSVAALVVAGIALAACSASGGQEIADGTYSALVPSAEQFAADAGRDIPGGFAGLRSAGIDQIELRIQGDNVTFFVDGSEAASRPITDRLELTDRQGSGPFKGRRQVLLLGTEPLAMGDLVIDEPVIWPGSFDESPVITLKPRNPEERGPDVQCGADEACLLLTSGSDPTGSYENANNPELNENPIASIEVASTFVEFTLDTGRQVRISRTDQSSTQACGLTETEVWDVPPEIGLAMDDPVVVHTVCPSTPGGAIQLTIIARPAIPTLAPLGSETDGDWCSASPTCLWFAPI
jgi:hypothetical protein